jgi:hypothetical protein
MPHSQPGVSLCSTPGYQYIAALRLAFAQKQHSGKIQSTASTQYFCLKHESIPKTPFLPQRLILSNIVIIDVQSKGKPFNSRTCLQFWN